MKDLRDDLEVTEAQVGALAAADCPFPPDLSLIVSNLPGEENEDQASLLQTVEFLAHWSSQISKCRLLDEQPLVPMPKLLWGKRPKMNGRAS